MARWHHVGRAAGVDEPGEDGVGPRRPPQSSPSNEAGVYADRVVKAGEGGTPRIGYVVAEFPVTSETFVVGEVRRLLARGLPIVPISVGLRRRANARMLADFLASGGTVEFLLDDLPRRVATAALPYLFRHPVRSSRAARANWALPTIDGVSKSARWLKILLLASRVQRLRLTHLHSHWTLPTDIAMIASRMSGITFSYSAHAHDIYEDAATYDARDPGSGTRDRIDRATFVATCTDHNVAHFRRVAPDVADKVHLIYHGVDRTTFDGGRAPSESGRPLLLGVGRLVAYKGFDTLVELCAELRDGGLDVACVIIGDGSQRSTLEARVAELGIGDRVRFLGSQPQRIIRDWLRTADLLVFCGRPELGQYGLPNVLFEAMAMGVPPVSTRLPNIEELITSGADGIVVDDPRDLLGVVAELLGSPETRRRLGEAARARIASRFDADVTIERMVALLRESMSRPGRLGPDHGREHRAT